MVLIRKIDLLNEFPLEFQCYEMIIANRSGICQQENKFCDIILKESIRFRAEIKRTAYSKDKLL